MRPRILTALPVYNEAAHVAGVLAEVQRYAENVLVVNDGSSDGTAEALAAIPGIEVETHARNRGYGAALKTAFCYAIRHGFDVVVTIDCDGQHQPCLIPDLAALVYPEHGEPVDVVSGSRYLKQFDGDNLAPEDRRQINLQVTRFINDELGLGLTDAFCGFKAYRVLPLQNLDITEPGYAMPLQLWVQIARLGLRVVGFPVPRVYLEEERSFGGSLDDARRRLAYYREVLDRELASFTTSSHADEDRRELCD